MTDTELFIGATADGIRQSLVLKRANRHGLIAGATGTGKTVTLQGLAENFSAAGVPVFVADVKGDLSGIAMAGSATAKPHAAFAERAAAIGDSDWQYRDTPVVFWDLFGEAGHPIRATVSEMGPVLLGRMLNLNDVQDGVLTIAPATAMSASNRSVRSSGRCCSCGGRAATASSANRRSTWRTSCASPTMGAASCRCSPPTS